MESIRNLLSKHARAEFRVERELSGVQQAVNILAAIKQCLTIIYALWIIVVNKKKLKVEKRKGRTFDQ